MKILGIDPGINGGIAVFTNYDDRIKWETYVMPTVDIGSNRKELDISTVISTIRIAGGYIRHDPDIDVCDHWQEPFTLAIIEQPPKIPKNGILGTASLFKGFGELRGVLKTLDIPFEQPLPQQWKKVILAGTPKDKNAAINYVLNRYPKHIELRKLTPKSRKFHDGIADAVCLAEYGRRLLGKPSYVFLGTTKDDE